MTTMATMELFPHEQQLGKHAPEVTLAHASKWPFDKWHHRHHDNDKVVVPAHAVYDSSGHLLRPNLKRSQSSMESRISEAVGVLKRGLSLGHHEHARGNQDRHVHFAEDANHELVVEVFERPTTTDEEKELYHYSKDELHHMAEEAKVVALTESKLLSQADLTIFEQGYLTFPESLHLFHHKRYYCLFLSHQMLFYSSPEHAARNTHLKCKIIVSKVIDCATMSRQHKVAAWGAHWPASLSLMFFVMQPNGDRTLFATETRSSKRNWMHALNKINYVEYALRNHVTATPCANATVKTEKSSKKHNGYRRAKVERKTSKLYTVDMAQPPPALCFAHVSCPRSWKPKTTNMARRGVVALLVVALLALSFSDTVAKKKKADVLTGEEKVEALNGLVHNGMITMNTGLYQKYVLRPDRPYHFVLLFTALSDKYSCEVCRQVAPEFDTLAESYVTAKQVKVDTRDGLEIFFAVVDFDSNSEIYGVYEFTSAPHIVYVGPDRSEDAGRRAPNKVTLDPQDTYNVYSQGKRAEDIVQYVKQKTGFNFEIARSKAHLYAILAGVLVVLIVLAKIILSNIEKVLMKLRRKRLWMTVSLLFYGLSVSGMVYCIIREPPAYQMERNGQIKYFNPGGRSQYVVEGLIIGGYDVAAAGFLILLSQWAVYLHNAQIRIAAIVVCALGFVGMYKLMISCYIYKNRWYTGWMGF
ncbi:TPA: hypothetical protein N0F65_000115 [Lagenidium giganteum]|uniref:PH domain-containing protein n=1 Tax=Lagenidium giganteum TaxID=4803 RepID=A0AAV2YVS2_9STRA|nr:TPA: hypothetical protein N0F65_000115 [Lagenidium giganteum]